MLPILIHSTVSETFQFFLRPPIGPLRAASSPIRHCNTALTMIGQTLSMKRAIHKVMIYHLNYGKKKSQNCIKTLKIKFQRILLP